MKAFFAVLALMSSFLSLPLPAQARLAGPVLHEVFCQSEAHGFDHGTSVTVEFSLITKQYSMTTSVMTIAGTKSTTELVQKHVPDRPGAPVVYENAGRSLSINFTVTPSPEGQPGQLTVLDLGSRKKMNSTALRCQLLKIAPTAL